MTGKYTPGPWLVNGKQSIRGENGEYIAKANWKNGANNARLIAAAPDMLEALEKCLNFISNTEGEIGEDLICGNAARAAIAKAEGRA